MTEATPSRCKYDLLDLLQHDVLLIDLLTYLFDFFAAYNAYTGYSL